MPIKGLPSSLREPKQEDIRKFLTMHKAGLVDGGSRSPENGNSDKENEDDVSELRKDALRVYQRKSSSEVLGLSSKNKDGVAGGPVVKLEPCPVADAKRGEGTILKFVCPF